MLPKTGRFADMERHLKGRVNDVLFSQKPKGLARRLFAEFSKYTHGVSGFTDGDARESNGPIFLPKTFLLWCVSAIKTYLVCLHEIKVAHPALDELPYGPPKLTLDQFCQTVLAAIPDADTGRNFFKALADFQP